MVRGYYYYCYCYCYCYCYYYYYYYYYYYCYYGRSLSFCPRNRLEDVRRCTKRGNRGLSWTSARQALAKTVALGGGCDGLRRHECWRNLGTRMIIRAGSFLPVEAAEGYKTVAGAYFRGRGACTQYDPKVILGAKTLGPRGDAYYGS